MIVLATSTHKLVFKIDGVASLIIGLSSDNYGPLLNLPICQTSLYIIITFEPAGTGCMHRPLPMQLHQ